MAEDIEIEVDIDGSTDVAPKTVDEAADNLKRGMNERSKTEETALAAAAEANRRLLDERAARQRTEHEMSQVKTKLVEAERVGDAASYEAVTSALTAAEELGKSLVSEKAKLMTDGEFAKASELDLKIAEVGGNIAQLKAVKTQVDTARKVAKDAPAPRVNQQAPNQTEMEKQDAWLATQNPINAAWIRQNRDKYFSDVGFQRKVNAASQEAIAFKGLKPEDSAYLEFIETKVGLREPAPTLETTSRAGETEGRKSEPAAGAPPRPAAPPSRQALSSEPGRMTQRITLTPDEAAIARQTLTPDIIGKNPDGSPRDPLKVFALRKAELIRDKRIF